MQVARLNVPNPKGSLARRIDPQRAIFKTRNDLTTGFIKSVGRQGIGNMPRISRGEVSNTQLVRIAAYLGKSDYVFNSRKAQAGIRI